MRVFDFYFILIFLFSDYFKNHKIQKSGGTPTAAVAAKAGIVDAEVPGLRGLKSEPLYLDVENALAAAYGDNSGSPSPEESMQDSNISKYSPEKFPLVIGGVLFITSLGFAAYAAVVVFQTQKKDRPNQKNDRCSELQRHSSFFGDQRTDKDLISNTENHALMLWKDLSCRYPSRKSGCADIMTLSGTTGEIRCKELVAIMVSDICDMLQLISLNVSLTELLPYLDFYNF